MRIASLLQLAGLVLALAPRLHAQSAPGPARAVWLTYAGEHAVASRLSLLADVQLRRDGDFATWRQLLLRGGLAWAPVPRARLAAGYGYLRSWPDEMPDVSSAWPEHRAWQMAQLSHGVGPLAIMHRARVEERWVADAFVTTARRWSYSTRGRYLLRAALPLRGDRLSLVGSEEVFASVTGHATAVDQNRWSAALSARVTPALRVELGYLERASVDDNRYHARDHALLVSFLSAAPLRHPAAP